MPNDNAPRPTTQKILRIKKYPNRRYYDAAHSRHVTLEEIYSLIRRGYEVEATDSKTGQDITAKVLAQIIIELDTPKLGVFPVPLLHHVLRANERLAGEFIDKYFSQPLTQFLDSQRSMERYFRQAIGLHSPTPTVAEWTKMMWGPFNPALRSGRPEQAGGPAADAGTRNGPAGKGAESSPQDQPRPRSVVDEMRREMAQKHGKRRRATGAAKRPRGTRKKG